MNETFTRRPLTHVCILLILLICSVAAIRYFDAPIEWIRAVPVLYVLGAAVALLRETLRKRKDSRKAPIAK